MTSDHPKDFTTESTSDPSKDTNSHSACKSACNPAAERGDTSTGDALSDSSGDTTTKVKSDWLICKYGNKLMGNQEGSHRRYDYVSQKLRELGRFLLAAKSLDSGVQTLQDLLAPGRLGLSLSAARKASGYRWSRPPLAVKTTLKTLCEIANLQDGDGEAAPKTTDFYHLLGREWDQLGLQNPDSNTDEAVGAELKTRMVPSRGGKCKEVAELRPEVLSPSRTRTSTST